MSSPVTGRISRPPSAVLDAQILRGQFEHEARWLLGHYVAIERALTAEYGRMAVLTAAEVAAVDAALDTLDPDAISADPERNHSDIAFAIEQHVTRGLKTPIPAWHVDRSRNDLQATAQRMYVRDRVVATAEALADLVAAVLELADRYTDVPMPGQTHLQAAQVVSPGFVLAALAGESLAALGDLAGVYAEVDRCPLGAGAMAGQELPWDRDRLAAALGFGAVAEHALTAVASRRWALVLGAALSNLGVTLSRFATDLMTWGGQGFGFLRLPDELSGISSAMPQKRNYPVLERIRGRTAHLTAGYVDLATGQRNTSYTNLVEVSKEASANLPDLLDDALSVLVLLRTVVEHAEFDVALMRRACEQDYLGGFSLANGLTLSGGLPWRTAQVVAGRYVVAALAAGRPPTAPDGALLAAIAAEYDVVLTDPAGLLATAFDVDRALTVKVSAGSTNPDRVRAELARLGADLDRAGEQWATRRDRLAQP